MSRLGFGLPALWLALVLAVAIDSAGSTRTTAEASSLALLGVMFALPGVIAMVWASSHGRARRNAATVDQ